MCQMERRNITNEFLKECIADALLRLMQEKPLESISIIEITDLAGVGRSTYYRNFNSKEDILAFKLQLLAKRWLKEEKLPGKPDYKAIIQKACLYLYSIRDLINLLYQNGQIDMVCTTLYNFIGPTATDDKIVKFQKATCSFGAFGIVYQWLKDGMQEGPDELAEIIWRAFGTMQEKVEPLYQ